MKVFESCENPDYKNYNILGFKVNINHFLASNAMLIALEDLNLEDIMLAIGDIHII